MLDLLARNKGKVVTKRMILEQVWDAEGAFVEENTVNVTLNRLKKKIEPDPSDPIYIRKCIRARIYILGSRFTEKQIYRAICREDSCTGNMFQRRKRDGGAV